MKASKKLIGASVALVAALAVSVGTTYAWFTTNNTVTVDNIQAQVTTGDSNLEIALITKQTYDATQTNKVTKDAEIGNFSYGISFKGFGETGYEFSNILLDALTSTNDGVSLTSKPTVDSNAGTATPGSAATEGSYIELYFRLRTPAADATTEIILGTNSAVTSKTDPEDSILAWETIAANSYGTNHAAVNKDSAITANAANVTRVAFLPATFEGKEDDGPANSTVKAGTTSNGVWIPNKGVGYDARHATSGYKLAEAYEIQKLGTSPDAKAVDAIKAKYADVTYTKEITAGSTTSGTVLTLSEKDGNYYYNDLCVKIWLEGTDGECFNNIFNDLLTINLEFTIKK